MRLRGRSVRRGRPSSSISRAAVAITLHYTLYFLLQLADGQTDRRAPRGANGRVPLQIIKYVHVYDPLATRSLAVRTVFRATLSVRETSSDNVVMTDWEVGNRRFAQPVIRFFTSGDGMGIKQSFCPYVSVVRFRVVATIQ